jgi:hypothetical protein
MRNSAKQSPHQLALWWCAPVQVLAKQLFSLVASHGEHCLALQILRKLSQLLSRDKLQLKCAHALHDLNLTADPPLAPFTQLLVD